MIRKMANIAVVKPLVSRFLSTADIVVGAGINRTLELVKFDSNELQLFEAKGLRCDRYIRSTN